MNDLPRDLDGGRFTLLERIGRGGYGEVFRAVQTSVDRVVAVKLVHEHLEHRDDVARRFRREARLASRLDHPNAVRVIDFGDCQDGLYLAMEYVDGPTLKSLVREGPLAHHRVRPIVRGIASALDAAHRLELVHRDLKPANILLPSDERPVVIDFGLVKVFSGDDDATAITRSNVMIGTPGYLSPEAVLGGTIDGRSDLYALGVLLYELLSGSRPFKGGSVIEVATARLHEAPPPLPDSVPDDLRALTRWLLAREPAERPGSAAEVVDFLDGAAPEAHAATTSANATIAPVRGPAASLLAPPPDPPTAEPTAPRPSARDSTAPTAPAATPPRRRAPRGVSLAAAALLGLAALGAAWRLSGRGDEDPDSAAFEPAPTGAAAAAPTAAPRSAPAPATPGAQETASRPDGALAPTAEGAALESEAGGNEAGGAEAEAPSTAAGAGLDAPEASGTGLAAAPATDHEPEPEPEPRRERSSARRSARAGGSLSINVEPWGIVWVDGERIGEAPVTGLALAPGTHVVMTRYGEQEREERVTIEPEQPTTVTHRYRR